MINKRLQGFRLKLLLFASIILCFSFAGRAQVSFKGLEHLFTTPKGYVTPFTAKAPVIDGDIQDGVWQQAPWAENFEDIEGPKKPSPVYKTGVKMLWNDSCLFVAAQLREPHVWATLRHRDAIIYYDNDFEMFIDPDNDTHQYFEVEINALNTVLDLFMTKPYRNGGGAMLAYDVTGLQSAVMVQGTLNDPSDKDSSWTLELAIPFRSLYIGNRWRAPQEGATWRVNFSRVQWDTQVHNGGYRVKTNEKGARLPEHNWVWSPQGVINMHYPERWGYLQFTRKPINEPFSLSYEERRKQYLWLVYYRQKEYRSKNGQYASSLKRLGITEQEIGVSGKANKLAMEATSRQFTVSISDGNKVWLLNDEGQVLPVLPVP
jgi:hypothetical protein